MKNLAECTLREVRIVAQIKNWDVTVASLKNYAERHLHQHGI